MDFTVQLHSVILALALVLALAAILELNPTETQDMSQIIPVPFDKRCKTHCLWSGLHCFLFWECHGSSWLNVTCNFQRRLILQFNFCMAYRLTWFWKSWHLCSISTRDILILLDLDPAQCQHCHLKSPTFFGGETTLIVTHKKKKNYIHLNNTKCCSRKLGWTTPPHPLVLLFSNKDLPFQAGF